MWSEEGVGEDEELAHDGGESEFCRLTAFDERHVFGLQVWVEARRDEGWHVEGLPAAARPPRMKARVPSRQPDSHLPC